jgi:carboxymethylenebutenolidase
MNDQADSPSISRRAFAALTTAAAASASCAKAQTAKRAEDVQIKTADGVCDGVLIHPTKGPAPGVVIWPDAFGLRPSVRELGARLAGEGYAVLVVNQFYRSRKAPVFDGPVNFQDPATRAQLTELRAPLTSEAVSRDAAAFVAFLDKRPEVNAKARIGTAGYCMGGSMAIRTAAAAPERVGAVCSFHGGQLVTDAPDSPHRLVAKTKAAYFIGISGDDDAKEPKAKDELKAAFAAAKLKAKVELFPESKHGWTQPDSPIYNRPDAEKAWAEMTSLYKSALV